MFFSGVVLTRHDAVFFAIDGRRATTHWRTVGQPPQAARRLSRETRGTLGQAERDTVY